MQYKPTGIRKSVSIGSEFAPQNSDSVWKAAIEEQDTKIKKENTGSDFISPEINYIEDTNENN